MSCDLISVLMPVYNVGHYISDAVESILHQTYKEIELIIVDDCSTDLTWDILQGLAKRDSRIVLLQNSVNSKIVSSLNRALAVAKGNYIARMDGDDIAHVERIGRQYNYLCENPHIALVGVSTISIDECGNEFARQELISNPILIEKTEFDSVLLNGEIRVVEKHFHKKLNTKQVLFVIEYGHISAIYVKEVDGDKTTFYKETYHVV